MGPVRLKKKKAEACVLALNCCYEYKEDVQSVTSGLMCLGVKFSL